MQEVYSYLDKIEEELDKSSVIKKYSKAKNKVLNDKGLMKLIDDYKKTFNPSLKKELINNSFYREYLKCENDVNFLILEINKILKEIVKKDGGSCESNKW